MKKFPKEQRILVLKSIDEIISDNDEIDNFLSLSTFYLRNFQNRLYLSKNIINNIPNSFEPDNKENLTFISPLNFELEKYSKEIISNILRSFSKSKSIYEFTVGDKVKVRLGGKDKYYGGTVTAVNDGLYNIKYNNGKKEFDVSADLIQDVKDIAMKKLIKILKLESVDDSFKQHLLEKTIKITRFKKMFEKLNDELKEKNNKPIYLVKEGIIYSNLASRYFNGKKWKNIDESSKKNPKIDNLEKLIRTMLDKRTIPYIGCGQSNISKENFKENLKKKIVYKLFDFSAFDIKEGELKGSGVKVPRGQDFSTIKVDKWKKIAPIICGKKISGNKKIDFQWPIFNKLREEGLWFNASSSCPTFTGNEVKEAIEAISSTPSSGADIKKSK